uniref:Ribosomal processing cysteine protease Prp n=1 Tax=Anaerobacillus isosaccharinicus TaxID=1532552 RepID=A0A1S2L9G8_9BACI|nr:ribosomal-processing cysteine protease Prp [Anaerobacillus isosaccharinicus]
MIYKFGYSQVVFTKEVVKTFVSYKQIKKNQHESGGILLGKVYKDLVLVDTVSEPSREDKSGRYYFFRNVKKAQKIIEDAWNNSQGERIYLGEWHTHPEAMPTPSIDDRKLLSNMLKDTRMEIEFLLMTIIGQSDNYVGVQQKGKKVIDPLSRVTSTDGIEITIYKNALEKISGFKVSGFINFAPTGYDIYNAALSQIFTGAINSIISLTSINEYILVMETGFIRFVIPNLKNEEERVHTLFNSMLIQIDMVVEEIRSKNFNQIIKYRFDASTIN